MSVSIINNDETTEYHMAPQLWTVKANRKTDTGRLLASKTATDLTNAQSREMVRNLRALGWDARRDYQ